MKTNDASTNTLWNHKAHDHVRELRGAMVGRVSELASDRDVAPMLGGLLGRLDGLVVERGNGLGLQPPVSSDSSVGFDSHRATALLSSSTRKLAETVQKSDHFDDPQSQRRVQRMVDVMKSFVDLKDELLSRSSIVRP